MVSCHVRVANGKHPQKKWLVSVLWYVLQQLCTSNGWLFRLSMLPDFISNLISTLCLGSWPITSPPASDPGDFSSSLRWGENLLCGVTAAGLKAWSMFSTPHPWSASHLRELLTWDLVWSDQEPQGRDFPYRSILGGLEVRSVFVSSSANAVALYWSRWSWGCPEMDCCPALRWSTSYHDSRGSCQGRLSEIWDRPAFPTEHPYFLCKRSSLLRGSQSDEAHWWYSGSMGQLALDQSSHNWSIHRLQRYSILWNIIAVLLNWFISCHWHTQWPAVEAVRATNIWKIPESLDVFHESSNLGPGP